MGLTWKRAAAAGRALFVPALAALALVGPAGHVSAAQSNVVVTAAVFPAQSCQEGPAQSGPGSDITCKGVNDWWAASAKAYGIAFGGYVNSSGQVTGDLQFKEWSPYVQKPIFQYDFGQQHLSLSGEWFHLTASAVRSKPGDYWAGLYFNGKVIGWTPVNMSTPSK